MISDLGCDNIQSEKVFNHACVSPMTSLDEKGNNSCSWEGMPSIYNRCFY
jgi:hypothetical protein